MHHFKLLTFIFLAFVMLGSCSRSKAPKGIDEGVLTYQITYLESEKNNPVISLLPGQIKLIFKQNNVVLRVEGWMGVFKSSFIRNEQLGMGYTTLKIMNKKLYYECTSAADFMGISDYNDVELSFDEKRKDILGYNCKHVSAKVINTDISFDIFYTSDIKITNAGEFTPFAEVPGVLMEFQLSVNGIPMHVIANNIYSEEISLAEFQLPASYTKVVKSEVDDIFISLVE